MNWKKLTKYFIVGVFPVTLTGTEKKRNRKVMDSWTPNVNFTKAGPSVYLGVIQLVPTQNFRVRVRVRG